MIGYLLLALCALACFASGFLVRHAFVPSPEQKAVFDLTDEALAHIAHEAQRAYQRSLGVIVLKTWNNLSPETREAARNRMAQLRNAERRAVRTVEGAIVNAIIGLAGKPKN